MTSHEVLARHQARFDEYTIRFTRAKDGVYAKLEMLDTNRSVNIRRSTSVNIHYST